MTKRVNLSQWHILVVDDDEQNATVQADILRSFKANTYIALSGSSALSMVAALPQLTAIILDLKMPGISGWDLLRHLRAMPQVLKVPIVAVTAYAMAGDRERILAAGFDGYVAKPVQVGTFWLELAGFIAQKRSA